MNFITLYFPSYSSLAQPLKLFWTQSTVLPTHCTFRNRDITYKSPFTAKHYLRFIRAKSLPSAAMKVLLLFLKGFQLFAAGVAMPHKHTAKAQTDSEEIPLLSSCPEVLHKCHFDTLMSSTHIWARRRLSPSTLTSWLLSTALADEVPLISKLQCRGYSIRALCWTICQFICFPWDIPLTFSRHLCVEEEHHTGFSRTGRAQSCAAPLHWRTQGTLWGLWVFEGAGKKHPLKLSSLGHVPTDLITYYLHTNEAGGRQREQGGKRRENHHCMSV